MPCYNIHNVERKFLTDSESWEWRLSFIGQPMQHNYYLYYIIDKIMEDHQVSKIVEIGTGYGALTTVLGLWGIAKDIPVLTVDIQNMHNEKIFKALDITYLQVDEFGKEFEQAVSLFTKDFTDKVLFICDGGNKIREFNLWAPHLASGSIIAIHDWTVEVRYSDIENTVKSYCIPYNEPLWNKLNVQFATFKVK